MRTGLMILLLTASANAQTVDDCAINPDRACPVEVTLADLNPISADPVATAPGQLTFLAQDDAATLAVDLSLTDGQLLRQTPLNLGEGDFTVGTGLVAHSAQGYALHIWQGGADLGVLFIDATGEPLALMRATWPADWPLEISLAEAVLLLAQQNALSFDGNALEGKFYRFGLRATASDGRLLVAELSKPINAEDTLGAYLERRLAAQIDPVGAESVQFEGPLSAVTTTASDGNPSRLLLRSEDGGEIAFDQRLGPERMKYEYQAARVTTDGRYLAAVRSSATDTLLMIFDTATTAPVFQAQLPTGGPPRVVWLPDRRIAVLRDAGTEGTTLIVLAPELP